VLRWLLTKIKNAPLWNQSLPRPGRAWTWAHGARPFSSSWVNGRRSLMICFFKSGQSRPRPSNRHRFRDRQPPSALFSMNLSPDSIWFHLAPASPLCTRFPKDPALFSANLSSDSLWFILAHSAFICLRRRTNMRVTLPSAPSGRHWHPAYSRVFRETFLMRFLPVPALG
jgi:hypothetical protein